MSDPVGALVQLWNKQRQGLADQTTLENRADSTMQGGSQMLASAVSNLVNMGKKKQFSQDLASVIQNEQDPQKQIQGIMRVGAKYGGFMGMENQVKMYVDAISRSMGQSIYKTDAQGNLVRTGFVEKGAKVLQNKGNEKGKVLISPMIDKISKNEDAYYGLDNSLQTLQANADKFSQFMGPGKSALRNPVRSYVNKDLQDFLAWKANVQDAFQQYRVAVTGAQASDKEIALLAKNRPNENDTFDVFVKKTAAVRNVGNQVIKRYINNLGKAGYDISGYQADLDKLNVDMKNSPENGTEMPHPRKTIKLPSGATITLE